MTAAPAAASRLATVTADQCRRSRRVGCGFTTSSRGLSRCALAPISSSSTGVPHFTVLPAGDTAKADAHANGVTLDDTDDTGLNPNGPPTQSSTSRHWARPRSRADLSRPPPAISMAVPSSSGAPLSGPPALSSSTSHSPHVRLHLPDPRRMTALKVLPAAATVPSAAQVDKQIAKRSRPTCTAPGADSQANRDAVKQNKDGLGPCTSRPARRATTARSPCWSSSCVSLTRSPATRSSSAEIAQRTPHRRVPGRLRDRDGELVRPLRDPVRAARFLVSGPSGRPDEAEGVATVFERDRPRSCGTISTRQRRGPPLDPRHRFEQHCRAHDVDGLAGRRRRAPTRTSARSTG